MRIGILLCGKVPPEIECYSGDYKRWFERFLHPVLPAESSLTSYEAYLGHLPEDSSVCDAWIISGSVASVNEDAQWIRHLEQWLLTAASRTKIVGVCFGHQIIAKTFGGRVGPSRTGWHAGVETYDVGPRQQWMRPELARFSLVASHQEEVLEPPLGAKVLAGNRGCPVGMMQIGDRLLGIQLHPEMTTDTSARYIVSRMHILGEAKAAAARSSLSKGTQSQTIATWLLGFIERS